jgi:hypothetical protein
VTPPVIIQIPSPRRPSHAITLPTPSDDDPRRRLPPHLG